MITNKRIMKTKILVLLVLGGLALVACSKLVDSIPAAPEVTVHKTGITDPASPNFHGILIREMNWDLRFCQNCHSGNFSGGIADASCLTCHTEVNGPGACNTCHGDFDNPDFIAPPQDTHNNTSTNEPGVGAHVSHLYSNELGKSIECSTCHVVPQVFSDQGHIDDTPDAEVIFGNLAVHNIAVAPVYNYSSVTCSDVYCHGNFEFLKDSAPVSHQIAFEEGADRMTGNNRSVVWTTVDGSQDECGSCHGLPPTGHIYFEITACGTCHSGIVDRNGNMVDSLSYKHINGEVDLYF